MSKPNTTASRKARRATMPNPDQQALPFDSGDVEEAAEAAAKAETDAAVAAASNAEAVERESFEVIRDRVDMCSAGELPDRCLYLITQDKYSNLEMGGLLKRMHGYLDTHVKGGRRVRNKKVHRRFDNWVAQSLRMDLRKAKSLMRIYEAVDGYRIEGTRLPDDALEGVGFSSLQVLVPVFSSKNAKVRAELPRLLDVARKRTFKELVEEMQKVRPPTKPGREADPMKLLSAALDRVFKDGPTEEAVRSIVELLQKRVIGLRLRITVQKTVLRKRVSERAEEVAAKVAALRDIAADLGEDDQDDRDGVTTLSVGKVA